MTRCLLPVLFFAWSLCVAGARPEFVLATDTAGGRLQWCGHTVAPCADAPVPPGDHIVEDPAAKVLSLGLHWITTPDATTGECLAVTYYWRVPESELAAPRYRVGVERVGQAEIVFVLTQESGAVVAVRSPRCALETAFCGKLEDVAKHLSLIDMPTLLKAVEAGEGGAGVSLRGE